MRPRAIATLVAALLCWSATAPHAQLAPYGQDFEAMDMANVQALEFDGWLVFGNVFDESMIYLYGYGPYPAPNPGYGGPAFSAVVSGEGGTPQGQQQLSVYSDYNNVDHCNGLEPCENNPVRWIESNLYQERTVEPGDVGNTWYFAFDAKRGNIDLRSTALAFIKTLDPASGYALTNFLQADMTSIPSTWTRYSLSITIDAGLVGQLLQFGFANTATKYEPSAIFYDNVEFTTTPTVGVPHPLLGGSGLLLRVHANPAARQAAQMLSFANPRAGHVSVRVYDVQGGLVGTLLDGELGAGEHQVTWRGYDTAGRPVSPGVYYAEVVAGSQRAVAKLNRLR